MPILKKTLLAIIWISVVRVQPMLEHTYVTDVTHEKQRRVLRHMEDGCVECDHFLAACNC